MRKPITPSNHGLIDYATTAFMLAAPSLLRLQGPGRTLSYAFAAGYLLESAVTDYRPALKRLLPFPVHGRIDLISAPAVLGAAYATGALQDPRNRAYFLGLLGMVASVYALTDWNGDPSE